MLLTINARHYGAGLMVAAAMFLSGVTPDANAAEQPRTITIQAAGTVLTEPDRASISTGVTSEGKTAAAALAKNSAAMSAIIAALKGDGIAQKDIQTTNFSVRPRYHNYRDGRPRVITGYVVTNSVRIRVHDIGRLGGVLDRVVALGSNQIGNIQFFASRADVLRDEARKAAFANAKRKAALYAEAAGVTLGQVLRLSEGGSRPGGPTPRFARSVAASAAPPPIEAGQQSLSVTVYVTWTID